MINIGDKIFTHTFLFRKRIPNSEAFECLYSTNNVRGRVLKVNSTFITISVSKKLNLRKYLLDKQFRKMIKKYGDMRFTTNTNLVSKEKESLIQKLLGYPDMKKYLPINIRSIKKKSLMMTTKKLYYGDIIILNSAKLSLNGLHNLTKKIETIEGQMVLIKKVNFDTRRAYIRLYDVLCHNGVNKSTVEMYDYPLSKLRWPTKKEKVEFLKKAEEFNIPLQYPSEVIM